jgi:hypothetical protein
MPSTCFEQGFSTQYLHSRYLHSRYGAQQAVFGALMPFCW